MYIISPIEPSVSAGQNTGMLFLENRVKVKERDERDIEKKGGVKEGGEEEGK